MSMMPLPSTVCHSSFAFAGYPFRGCALLRLLGKFVVGVPLSDYSFHLRIWPPVTADAVGLETFFDKKF